MCIAHGFARWASALKVESYVTYSFIFTCSCKYVTDYIYFNFRMYLVQKYLFCLP
jgi:hypothetical protein